MLAPKQIFILLVNSGTDNEGIHTIQIEGRNTVLMFESEDDATRYALMLEAQDFPVPVVEGFPMDEIEEFCRSAECEWEIVEAGKLAIPPEVNVEETDWTAEGKKAEEPETSASDDLDDIRRRLEGLL